jgi:hypothetical protein
MALFFVPVKLYAKIGAEGESTSVEVAATTTKGNATYQDEFTSLTEGLRRALPPSDATERDGNRVKVYA